MPINLLIIDDSAVARRMLAEFVADDPDIAVIGTASDPLIAREKIKALSPDVLSLDIEMPRMNGLSFLEKLMALRPMPVVVVSALSGSGAEVSLRALELGAVEVMAKPGSAGAGTLTDLALEFRRKVKTASRARIIARAEPAAPRRAPRPASVLTDGLIAIGASTGGVEALGAILEKLPANTPPVLVTQHMPRGFTGNFARRLNTRCAMTVQEASQDMPIRPGQVYIAPGDAHLLVSRHGGVLVCALSDAPAVSGHRPSVDVMFASVAELAGTRRVGVILTGMGHDGAAGLGRLRATGGYTIGQSEASCVVYGMPRAAREAGAVAIELPLHAIGAAVLDRFSADAAVLP